MMELIEPRPPKATLEQGFSYIKKGEFDKAISAMDELITGDPYLSQAYWGRALCLEYRAVSHDDARKAISDYSKSIVYANEPSALSFGRRGILYFKTGMYEEALADLSCALKSDLYWIEARFYRGRTYVALSRNDGDAQLAVKDFDDVIKHVPEPFAPAHFWRAQALRLLEKNEDAVADYIKALEIDSEDVLALNALAYCSEHGIGTPKDRDAAEKLYEKAANLDFLVAQKNLAWFYTGDETGACEDAERSAYWMYVAAQSGDAEAQDLYALRLLHGKGIKRDGEQAAYYFALAAKQDYLPAVCNLAECFERGEGVGKDALRAFKLYEKAAAQGSVLAAYNVGRYYYFGIGVAEDNDKAFAALKPLADSGYARAQDIVGLCYENGYGTPRDIELANKYYMLAYKQGYAHAATHLATNLRCGRGIKKNVAKAIRLYTEAAEKGSAYARFALGRLFFEEKRDYDRAVTEFRLAISEGKEDISGWLARALMRAKNPEEHIGEAYALLIKSASEEQDKLYPAIVLRRLEFTGFCGFPLNQKAAVERVSKLLPQNGESAGNLSCAYSFLAQAYELGLGVRKNLKTAFELYHKAAKISLETKGCRCFVAGLAHILYQGIGCEKDPAAADRLVEAEMDEYGDDANSEVGLLYMWSKLSQGGADIEALEKIGRNILRDDPYDEAAAYMLYYMHRDAPDAEKHLRKLRKILATGSPYYRFMIENQLETAPDKVLYPLLTGKVIARFKKQGGKLQ